MASILAVVHLLLAAAAGALPPHCQIETVPAAKAACIGLAADEILHAADLTLAGISAGVQGAETQALARFQAELAKLQRSWRAEMEAECGRSGEASEIARQTCRHEAATERHIAIGRTVTEAQARLTGAEALIAPDTVEVFIPLPRHRRARPGALPHLCLEFPISGAGAALGWSRCGSER